MNGAIFAVGAVAITLSLFGALWATNHYKNENGTFRLAGEADGTLAPPVVVTASGSDARRSDVLQPGVVGGRGRLAGGAASVPLGWNDLTLMLRTGLTDEEVIAAAAGKQLTTAIGPDEERQLRELGAGNRLLGYLRGQLVYAAPAYAAPAVASAPVRPVVAPPTSYVPAATPFPTVDYAARDRQVAALKKRIDNLDDQIRVARSRPNDYPYSGRYYYYRNDGMSQQQSADGYIKGLEEQRDELRRQKWQLEGR